MQERDQYRTFAEFCEQLAQQDRMKQHRASLIEMAERWRELAETATAAAKPG